MTQNGIEQDDGYSSVSRAFPATRISFFYTSHAAKARITGLYRLLAIVEQCLYRASDHQVSIAKLTWWLDELYAARSGGGSHPLSLQLKSCGALDAWPEPLLKRLFTLALYRVDAAALSTEIELLDLCEAMGSVHLELECALLDYVVPNGAEIKQLNTVNGLMQLMRESFWATQASFYWVPLVLCAMLNLQRQQIVEDVTESGRLWVPVIAQIILGRFDCAASGAVSVKGISSSWSRDNQHWLIFSFLQQRQLQRMTQGFGKPDSAANVVGLISRIRFLDGWAAWRIARQLQSGKKG